MLVDHGDSQVGQSADLVDQTIELGEIKRAARHAAGRTRERACDRDDRNKGAAALDHVRDRDPAEPHGVSKVLPIVDGRQRRFRALMRVHLTHRSGAVGGKQRDETGIDNVVVVEQPLPGSAVERRIAQCGRERLHGMNVIGQIRVNVLL